MPKIFCSSNLGFRITMNLGFHHHQKSRSEGLSRKGFVPFMCFVISIFPLTLDSSTTAIKIRQSYSIIYTSNDMRIQISSESCAYLPDVSTPLKGAAFHIRCQPQRCLATVGHGGCPWPAGCDNKLGLT